MRFGLFALIVVWILVGGCASDKNSDAAEDTLMNSFLGHPQTDLISKLGTPTRTVADEDGGSILIYEVTDQNKGKVYTERGSGLRYNIPVTSRARIFFVDEKGIVTRWSWRAL